MVSTVTAPIAMDAGLRENILIMEDPIFCLGAFCDTALNIEKFSIPHVSGIQIVSAGVWDKISEQSKTWLIDKSEPRLHAILMDDVLYVDILVFPLGQRLGLILIARYSRI